MMSLSFRCGYLGVALSHFRRRLSPVVFPLLLLPAGWWWWWLFAAATSHLSLADAADAGGLLSCSVDPNHDHVTDPALTELKYNVGDGPATAAVYVEPDVTTFYQHLPAPPASTKVQPKNIGLCGKFINLSKDPVTLYWKDHNTGSKHAMRQHGPFAASGTATFPGHNFLFTPVDDPDTVLKHFVVGDYPDNIYYYDPYTVDDDPDQTAVNLRQLTETELKQYQTWRKTLSFHEQYRNATGRSYLANYLRPPPALYMWPADHFDQTHWVVSKETRFAVKPPAAELGKINATGTDRVLAPDEPRLLQEYREQPQQPPVLNMTLKVLSCAPRVFEIEEFLSRAEIDHIMDIAAASDLKLSMVGQGNKGGKDPPKTGGTSRTRTSFNSWVPRETSPVIDAIYRRAADVMRIDESLLRQRDASETARLSTADAIQHDRTIAEQLQLVHYDYKQEYTAHHDFGFSAIDDDQQGARFATLLLYLNEPERGGETSFPRWVNAETFDELRVKPVAGNAVLFYSQLPDGNFDDFSHHAARPVLKGEKWLINLWVWSPQYKT